MARTPLPPIAAALSFTVIWVAEVRDGRLASWRIVGDTPATRTALGL